MAEGEVARDHLQQQLIDGVEQVEQPPVVGSVMGDVGLDSSTPACRRLGRGGLARSPILLALPGSHRACRGSGRTGSRSGRASLARRCAQGSIGAFQVGDGPVVGQPKAVSSVY